RPEAPGHGSGARSSGLLAPRVSSVRGVSTSLIAPRGQTEHGGAKQKKKAARRKGAEHLDRAPADFSGSITAAGDARPRQERPGPLRARPFAPAISRDHQVIRPAIMPTAGSGRR